MINYGPTDFEADLDILAQKLTTCQGLAGIGNWPFNKIYGIPRGGLPVAIALSNRMGLPLTDNPNQERVLIVDDLVDSGATMEKYRGDRGQCFACLHVKPHSPRPEFFSREIPNEWIQYFWEKDASDTVEENIVRCLQFIGEDPTREGLIETPARIIRAWKEIFAGYAQNPEEVFTCFEEPKVGGLVYLKDIEFYSTCEHHMLPFWGTAMIAYIPNGKVIGVSKLARLLDIYARRMQVQERIGEQVTTALMEHLKPVGAACMIEAKHLCISSRGVRKQHSVMGYNSLKGVFLDHSQAGIAARAELMSLWNRS